MDQRRRKTRLSSLSWRAFQSAFNQLGCLGLLLPLSFLQVSSYALTLISAGPGERILFQSSSPKRQNRLHSTLCCATSKNENVDRSRHGQKGNRSDSWQDELLSMLTTDHQGSSSPRHEPPESCLLPSRRNVMSASLLSISAALTGGSGPFLFGLPALAATSSSSATPRTAAGDQQINTSSLVREVQDPNTYPALVYEPPIEVQLRQQELWKPPPLIVVLHGAATNQEPSVRQALGDPLGEHAGLPMQLLASNAAPPVLADNFCVAAPYAVRKQSFYEEPREKLLRFVQYLANQEILVFDPKRIFLFGFSDGATVAVELATSRKFKGAVVASYGFTGPSLPPMALARLQGLGFWVFHAADDVIFDVDNSDRLVAALRETNGKEASEQLIRYSRYESDPLPKLGVPVNKSMRGHTMGIVAAQTPALYEWMLSL